MTKIIIDLNPTDLESLKKLAEKDHRKRKQYIELVLIKHLEENGL